MRIDEITAAQPGDIHQQMYQEYLRDQWVPHELDESRRTDSRTAVRTAAPNPAIQTPPVVFLKCQLYQKTLETQLARYGPTLQQALLDFQQLKTQDTNRRFGTHDRTFPSGRPLTRYVPHMGHCHLLSDSVLFYTCTGSNPKVIKLYAVTSHDEAGIGQPGSMPRQKSLGQKFGNQTF